MFVFTNARIFDGESAQLRDGLGVFVKHERIAEVSARPPTPDDGKVIDCAGRTLMPGLIDAHVHVYALSPNLAEVRDAAARGYFTAAARSARPAGMPTCAIHSIAAATTISSPVGAARQDYSAPLSTASPPFAE